MDWHPVRIGIASGLSPWSGTGFYWWSRIRTRKAKSVPGWKERKPSQKVFFLYNKPHRVRSCQDSMSGHPSINTLHALSMPSYRCVAANCGARPKYFFFPLLALLGIDLQQCSARYLLIHKREKYRALEAMLLGVHYILYFGMVFSCLNLWRMGSSTQDLETVWPMGSFLVLISIASPFFPAASNWQRIWRIPRCKVRRWAGR